MITARDITITFLAFIILICLIKILCCGDTIDKVNQKLIGGFSVFIVALLADIEGVYYLALFIGGLIIASENFMLFLAAILRSDSKAVSGLMKVLNRSTEATKEEVERKIHQEVEEAKEVGGLVSTSPSKSPNTDEKAEENFSLPAADYFSVLPKIEKKVLDDIQEKMGENIQRQRTFLNDRGNRIQFDGSITDNENRILKLFEVKIFPKISQDERGNIVAYPVKARIRKYLHSVVPKLDQFLKESSGGHGVGWRHYLTLVIVLNLKTNFQFIKSEIMELQEEINKLALYFKIDFIFYNLKDDKLDIEEIQDNSD